MMMKNNPSEIEKSTLISPASTRSILGGRGKKIKKGFSLIEAIVAISIFSLAAVLIAGSFASFLKNYSTIKRSVKNIENAQFGMNTMAKTLRTSDLLTTSFPLKVFDYSRTTENCIEYSYADNKIKARFLEAVDPDACSSADLASLTAQTVVENVFREPSLEVVKTDLTGSMVKFGKITIALQIKEVNQDTLAIPIQTTVSLRQ